MLEGTSSLRTWCSLSFRQKPLQTTQWPTHTGQVFLRAAVRPRARTCTRILPAPDKAGALGRHQEEECGS